MVYLTFLPPYMHQALDLASLPTFLKEQVPHVWAKLGAQISQDLKITEVRMHRMTDIIDLMTD